MIPIQIACDITATGVDGVRWVLLEPGDEPAPLALAPRPAAPLMLVAGTRPGPQAAANEPVAAELATAEAASPEAATPGAETPEDAQPDTASSRPASLAVSAPANMVLAAAESGPLLVAGPMQPDRGAPRIPAWQVAVAGLGLALLAGFAQQQWGQAPVQTKGAAAAPSAGVTAALPAAPALHAPGPAALPAAALAPVVPGADAVPPAFAPAATTAPIDEARGPTAAQLPGQALPVTPAPAASTPPLGRMITVGL